MKTFRYLSIFLALLTMVGEVYRSIGDGRHFMFVWDDILSGAFMIVAALLFTKDTPVRRAAFAGAWGVAVGMLYGSFFSKLLSDVPINSGNLNPDFLIIFIGISFAISIFALITAIFLPYKGNLP